MSEDRRVGPAPVRGQVLPAEADNLALPIAPLGIPVFAEIRNWSERRQVESFSRLAAAKNELLRLVGEQQRLVLEIRRGQQVAAAQIEHLDDIRAIEKFRILNELASLKRDADLDGLRREVEIEELNVRLADAKRRRAEIENPAPAQTKVAASPAEKLKGALEELRGLDQVLRDERDRVLSGAGGDLDEDAQQALERIEIIRRTHIEKLYEDLV